MVSTQQHAVYPGIVPHSNVLIIGPGSPIAQDVVQSAFRRRGHTIDLVSTEESARHDLDQFDLLIVELDVGETDAVRLCARLRLRTLTPLLVLVPVTARNQGIQALEMGADSFVLIPFDRRELMARAEALIRRHRRRWFPLFLR